MDPLRIAVRAIVVYAYLLTALRLSGTRTIRDVTAFDFVVGVIIGDLVDDALWQEVPMAQFVVASTTVMLTKLAFTFHRGRAEAPK